MESRAEKKENVNHPSRSLTTGPFTVFWKPSKNDKYTLFQVFSNELPNSAYTDSLEVKLLEILTKDGVNHAPPVTPDKNIFFKPWSIKDGATVGSYRLNFQTKKNEEYSEPPRQFSYSSFNLPDKLQFEDVKKIKALIRFRLLPEIKEFKMTKLNLGDTLVEAGEVLLFINEISSNDIVISFDDKLGQFVGAQIFNESGEELQREHAYLKTNFRNMSPIKRKQFSVSNIKGISSLTLFFTPKVEYVEYPFEIEY
jgi:hypothetical protein